MRNDFGASQSGRGYRNKRRQDEVTEQVPVDHRETPITIHAALSRALVPLKPRGAAKFHLLRFRNDAALAAGSPRR